MAQTFKAGLSGQIDDFRAGRRRQRGTDGGDLVARDHHRLIGEPRALLDVQHARVRQRESTGRLARQPLRHALVALLAQLFLAGDERVGDAVGALLAEPDPRADFGEKAAVVARPDVVGQKIHPGDRLHHEVRRRAAEGNGDLARFLQAGGAAWKELERSTVALQGCQQEGVGVGRRIGNEEGGTFDVLFPLLLEAVPGGVAALDREVLVDRRVELGVTRRVELGDGAVGSQAERGVGVRTPSVVVDVEGVGDGSVGRGGQRRVSDAVAEDDDAAADRLRLGPGEGLGRGAGEKEQSDQCDSHHATLSHPGLLRSDWIDYASLHREISRGDRG